LCWRFWRNVKTQRKNKINNSGEVIIHPPPLEISYVELKRILDLESTIDAERSTQEEKNQWEIHKLKQCLHDLKSPIAALSYIQAEITHGNSTYDELSGNLVLQVVDHLKTSDQFLEGEVTFMFSDIIPSIHRSIQTVSLRHQKYLIQLSLGEEECPYPHCPPLIERAVINLIENATEYAMYMILVSLKKEHDCLILSVEDDGHGLSVSEKTNSEVRLSAHGNRKPLGLASVQSIAKKHGGRLRYGRSRLGGAKFMIRLESK